MKVLVVEDSASLRKSLELGLRHAGFAVDSAADGPGGLARIVTGVPDVVVLDLMLPGLDGIEVIRRAREQRSPCAVLVLSARDTVEERVRGLRAGADDYLVKPFAFDELLARVQALARRRHGAREPRIKVGNLVVDLAARRVERAGKPIDLTPREYALVEYLALRRGAVVARADIEARLYGEGEEPMSNAVDRTVCTLRRKIDVEGAPSVLRTRRGLGYVLEEGGT